METLSKEQKEAKQVSDIDALRTAQKTGAAGMIRANKDDSIEIPEHGNDRYVYVKATNKHLNADMKSHTSVVSLIPVHAGLFDQMVDQGGFALYDDVKIVHDPRDNVRESYVFKVEQINSKSVETPSDAKSTKSSDMKAMNEARKQIEAQKVTLENKQAELTTKETEITAKEVTIADREARLKMIEEELAAREAALKNDGAGNQSKK